MTECVASPKVTFLELYPDSGDRSGCSRTW